MRVLRLPAVIDRTKRSKSTIRRLELAGRFPRRFPIGENSVGWLEDEIDAWIAEQAGKRDARPIDRHDDHNERATESVP